MPANHSLARLLRVPNWFYLALACLVLGVYFVTLAPSYDDFSIYYQAAMSLRHVGDPYMQAPAYIYPPPLAYLMQPLSFLSPFRAQQTWFVINCVLLGIFLRLCLQHAASEPFRRHWGAVVLGVVLAPPTAMCLRIGQIGILMAVLVVAIYATQHRSALAALCLAVASVLKIYPALFGLFFLRRRSLSVLVQTALAALTIGVLSLIGYGIQPYLRYAHNPFPRSAFPAEGEFNISLYGLWSRLFTDNVFAVPIADLPAVAFFLTAVTSLAALAINMSLTPCEDGPPHPLLFSLWLTLLLLVVPIDGYYNLVLLLFPLLSLIRYLPEYPSRALRTWCVFATVLLWIPAGWTDNLPWLYTRLHTGWGVLLLTPPIYSLLIYHIALVVLVRQSVVPRVRGQERRRGIALAPMLPQQADEAQ